MDASYQDKELFTLIAQGDEDAFAELFHRYTPKLLGFLTKLTRSPHLAQEMIQETFLRIWVNRAELKDIQQPSAWIYRIASNISISFLRKQSNRRRILATIPATDEEEALQEVMDSKELDLIIQRAVNLLPEKKQAVYRLSREQGLSHQQIAEKLQISPYTVKNQISSSLKFIQEFINRETGLSLVTLIILFSR